MRPGDERDNVRRPATTTKAEEAEGRAGAGARARLGALAALATEARAEEWGHLLEILRDADSPVGAAVHWIESHGGHGGGGGGAKRKKGNELWRLVPELLASEVVYVEEEEEMDGQEEEGSKQAAGTRVGNCIWMQTLPNAMQANILTLLSVEHYRFRPKDLELLARCVLNSYADSSDFWVQRAAVGLLSTVSSRPGVTAAPSSNANDKSTVSGMGEYDALPEWLDKFKEKKQNSSPFPPRGILGKEEGRGNANEGVLEERQQESPQSVKESFDMGESANMNNSGTLRQEIAGSVENGSNVIQFCAAFNEEPVNKLSPVRAGNTAPKDDEDNGGIHSPKVEAQKNDGNGDSDGLLSKDEARAELGNELFAQVMSLRSSLLSCGQADELPEEINLLRTTPGSKLPILLSAVRAWEMDDTVTLMLVSKFVTESDGYAQSTRILQSVVLLKLLKLDKPATRVLTAAVVHAGRAHPRATMDAVLFPLICSETGASSVQCDLLNRMVKDCLPAEVNLSLCEKMFASWSLKAPRSGSGASKSRWVWTEGMITVVQNLLSHRLNPDQRTVAGLVCALDEVVMEYTTSLKFANLLLTLITKYGAQLTPHKSILQGVADKSKTFLTKSLLTKLSTL